MTHREATGGTATTRAAAIPAVYATANQTTGVPMIVYRRDQGVFARRNPVVAVFSGSLGRARASTQDGQFAAGGSRGNRERRTGGTTESDMLVRPDEGCRPLDEHHLVGSCPRL